MRVHRIPGGFGGGVSILAAPRVPLRSSAGRRFSWPRSRLSPPAPLARSVVVLFAWFRKVSGGGLLRVRSVRRERRRPSATAGGRIVYMAGRTTYPIHSSAGGRPGGLTHNGESRRCSRNSAVYRPAMIRSRSDHQPGSGRDFCRSIHSEKV
jgi:hypothetical protein